MAVIKGSPEYIFQAHKRIAKHRKIEFLFTFDEWIKVWLESGHWHERGIRKDQYCMARFSDKGPYAVDNVKIITNAENIEEGGFKNGRNSKRKKYEKRAVEYWSKKKTWGKSTPLSKSSRKRCGLARHARISDIQ